MTNPENGNLAKKPTTKMDIRYAEASLEAVMQFYADAYTMLPGQRLAKADSFVDTAKGRVVFKLYVESELTP